MTMKFSLAILVLCCVSFSQDNAAMFGLTWGISPQDLQNKGIKLETFSAHKNMYGYRTDSLPKNLSNAEYYTLIFNNNTKLVKIVAQTQTIQEDHLGVKGKEAFTKISDGLKEKYKVEQAYTKSGVSLYTDADEFYQCLKHHGCGVWMASFSSPNKNIMIRLEGDPETYAGAGFITISVEAKPQWGIAVDTYQALLKQQDKDAF